MKVTLLVAVLALAGCGEGDKEAAPTDWCRETGTIMYLLDQYSTTHDQDRLGDWEVDESAVAYNQLVPTRGVACAPIHVGS